MRQLPLVYYPHGVARRQSWASQQCRVNKNLNIGSAFWPLQFLPGLLAGRRHRTGKCRTSTGVTVFPLCAEVVARRLPNHKQSHKTQHCNG
jgi:hypothetical protein